MWKQKDNEHKKNIFANVMHRPVLGVQREQSNLFLLVEKKIGKMR